MRRPGEGHAGSGDLGSEVGGPGAEPLGSVDRRCRQTGRGTLPAKGEGAPSAGRGSIRLPAPRPGRPTSECAADPGPGSALMPPSTGRGSGGRIAPGYFLADMTRRTEPGDSGFDAPRGSDDAVANHLILTSFAPVVVMWWCFKGDFEVFFW